MIQRSRRQSLATLAARLAPQQDRRPSLADGESSTATRRGGTHTQLPNPRERLAEESIGFSQEEWKSEHAAPGLPVSDHVAGVAAAVERDRESRIAVREHNLDPSTGAWRRFDSQRN